MESALGRSRELGVTNRPCSAHPRGLASGWAGGGERNRGPAHQTWARKWLPEPCTLVEAAVPVCLSQAGLPSERCWACHGAGCLAGLPMAPRTVWASFTELGLVAAGERLAVQGF